MLYNYFQRSHYIIFLILGAIFYYLLSRYYLSTNNSIKKENADNNFNWFSNALSRKSVVYLYLLIPIIYVVVQYFFSKSKK